MTAHILDEVRSTERQLDEAEQEYNAMCQFLVDAGETLSDESIKVVELKLRKLDATMNILSAHLGYLEAEFECAMEA